MAIDVQKYLKTAGGFSAAVVLASTLVVKWEGKENSTYIDPVGVPTVCYGHTGPEVKLGQRFTDEQCLKTLADDLKKHDELLLKKVKVPMNDYIHAALLDFTFNVGIGNLSYSSLLTYLNMRDYRAACEELSKWVYAKKKKLNGLVARRADEKAMCLQGVDG
jgi:lysozyme